MNSQFTKRIYANYRICKKYDEIQDRVNRMPDSTEDLVKLLDFIRQAYFLFNSLKLSSNEN